MITNPQVGQRIVVIDQRLDAGVLYGRTGTISNTDQYYLDISMVMVEIDHIDCGPILLDLREIERLPLTPEEEAKFQREEELRQDQQRRKEHADKYL